MEKNWSTVQLHCRECNARMMDYTLCQDDDRIVLQGITIKCNRCKRENGEEQLNNKLQKNSEKQRHCKFALSEQNHEFRKNIDSR